MAVPTTVADLSTVASSNGPDGSESPNVLDNYIRAHASIIRQVSDAAGGGAGGISGIIKGSGTGTISAATASDIVNLIGANYVANATSATNATNISDGAVSTAAKIVDGVITFAKHAAIATGKLIGRSTAGSGAPEEISIGSGLSLSAGTLSCTVPSGVSSVGGNTGAVTNAQLSASVAAALGYTPANPASFVGVDCNYNNVGSLCLAIRYIGSTALPVGTTIAGSNLQPSTAAGVYAAATLSGTWRCLGYIDSGNAVTLFQRIA